ncbi:MAG: PAS domain-containing protein [Candidatus Paceibacterota bacterium]
MGKPIPKAKNLKESKPLDFRCVECGKLLGRADKNNIALKIKCVRCGALNSLFKGITDQMIVTDPEGTILYANQFVELVTGYGLDEILGKKPSLWGGQMSQKFYEKLWKTIKIEKKSILVTVKNKKKDGAFYEALLQITPVFGPEKEIKLFIGIETLLNK